jgi:hypothetical protein
VPRAALRRPERVNPFGGYTANRVA